MKSKLSLGVCILISLALVTFGLFCGTWKGFADERAQVDALLHGEDGVNTVLDYRGADGLNLCVVARRHLTDDPDVAALESAAQSLRSTQSSLAEKKRQDTRLSAAAELVAQKLQATPGFLQSERDKAYLGMLTADMAQLSQNAMITTYNEAAQEFNQLLATRVSGTIAGFLQIQPCELFR